jgi:hypothetical protein
MLKIEANIEYKGRPYSFKMSFEPKQSDSGDETETDNDPDKQPPVNSGSEYYGVCTFPWVPVAKLKPFGSARIYCASHWIWQKDGLFIQPMFQAETAVAHGIDEMLENMKHKGVSPLLCIHQTPEWLFKTGDGTNGNDFPPTAFSQSRTNPIAYLEYAQFLWQVAARYGRKVHTNGLKVSKISRWTGDVPQVAKSGLDLLNFIEPWNECDKWWKRQEGKHTEYFEPEEMAAFLSACYDGHEGFIPNAGIKNADESMQVVLPGLTGCDMKYIKRMDSWFEANRNDKDWPCDIFNIHWYNNNGNTADKYPPSWNEMGAIKPQIDRALPQFLDVKQFVQNMGMPLWVTEFGCDSKGPSPMGHPDGEQGQADLIEACYAFYKEHGVERAFMFNAINEPGQDSGGLWQNCGVYTNEATGMKPKKIVEKLQQIIK